MRDEKTQPKSESKLIYVDAHNKKCPITHQIFYFPIIFNFTLKHKKSTKFDNLTTSHDNDKFD